MTKTTQLSLFDADAARAYQRQQRQAELKALMIQYIGEEATKKWYAKQKSLRQKLDAIYSQPLRPDLQASLDALQAEVMATARPINNDYALLNIEPGSSKRDIKNAYRRHARRLHPDKGGDPEAFKALYAAYRRLLAAARE